MLETVSAFRIFNLPLLEPALLETPKHIIFLFSADALLVTKQLLLSAANLSSQQAQPNFQNIHMRAVPLQVPACFSCCMFNSFSRGKCLLGQGLTAHQKWVFAPGLACDARMRRCEFGGVAFQQPGLRVCFGLPCR